MSAFVFLSYVREDSALVDRLRDELSRHGITVWLDRQSLLPGHDWEDVISQTISKSRFFIACFSANFAERKRSEMHAELRLAIAEIRRQPPEHLWFIPVKLSPCEVPAHSVAPNKTLRSYHTLELYSDWQAGLERLLAVIRRAETGMSTAAAEVAGSVVSSIDIPPSVLNEQRIKIGDLSVEGSLTFANDQGATATPAATQVRNQMSIKIDKAKAGKAEFINRRR